MRLHEAILADLPRLECEVERVGRISIESVANGGRAGAFALRWIKITDQVRAALQLALEVSLLGSQPAGSVRKLLAQQSSSLDTNRGSVRRHFWALGNSLCSVAGAHRRRWIDDMWKAVHGADASICKRCAV
jgi:hypothetical protein